MLSALSVFAAAGSASATWSIVLVNTRTGEIAVGSATCLTGFDLRANTPVLIPLVGAATAQSAVDSTGLNRVFIRDRLIEGVAPSAIITGLATFDGGQHQSRQYGIGDIFGRTASFSGSDDGAWAGGQTGVIGDIAYAVQGNVLTGPCVVNAAVNAITSSTADLPTRLMVAMEAARTNGGDGRCSCTNGAPDSCGCPPARFTKSAHIAYMMSARAGDLEGCQGLYRISGSPTGVLALDVSGNGLPDMLMTAGTQLQVYRNVTPAGGAPAPAFTSTPANVTNGLGRALRLPVGGDFTGDGRRDVAVFNSDGAISVFPVLAGGAGFGAAINSTGPIVAVSGVAAGDLNGDGYADLVSIRANTASVFVHLNSGAAAPGQFAAPAPITLPSATPVAVALADMNGDGILDIVVALSGTGTAVVFQGAADGTYTQQQPITVGTGIGSMVAKDLNGDGLVDLAFTLGGTRQVKILTQLAAGGFSTQTLTLSTTPARLIDIDINGDGRRDLVVASSGQIVTLSQDSAGVFTAGVGMMLNSGAANLLATADLDGDGRGDVVVTTPGALVTIPSHGGRLVMAGGCATGDYYLNLNIANQSSGNQDPVLQLRTQFNAFRAAAVGRPDAITSTATFDRGCVPTGYGPDVGVVLTVTPRDLNNGAVTSVIRSVTVTHAAGSAGLCGIGDATANADGTYSVLITSPAAETGGPDGGPIGTDMFAVTIDDGVRLVTLMPPPSLRVVVDADFNRDGIVNADDLSDFIQTYFSGGTTADFNHDGAVNSDDLGDFITAYFEAC